MRVRALIKRILLQMIGDKRTLGLMFIAPLFVLTLMYFIFNSSAVNLKLGSVNLSPGIVQALKDANFDVTEYPAGTAVNDAVIKDKLDGMLQINGASVQLTLQNTDPTKSKQITLKLNQILASGLNPGMGAGAAAGSGGIVNSGANAGSGGAAAGISQNNAAAMRMIPTIEVSYIYGNADTTFFDILSPILVGFFVFFFVFLIAGIGLLRERMTGTLERLMSTPVRRGEVITGYLLGFGIFAAVQTVIIVLYAIIMLKIVLVGSIWNVLLINLLMAFVALSLGILLSTFASSEFQMMQFIPIVIVPQVFFAGLFPLEGMAGWLRALSRIMPIYYGADALKAVMYKGLGLGDIWGDILALMIFAIVFIILNLFALKKYRKL